MSVKAMVFIDGGWFYRNRNVLFQKLGQENGFEIDYARLPKIINEDIANYLDEDVSLVRTNYFGTIPSQRSGFNVSKQSSFYDFLQRNCGYDTEIHEVEVGNGENRNDDAWTKMALASSLLFYAAQPGAIDVAVIIGDDPDLEPAIRRARLFGKRMQIVGVHALPGQKPSPSLFDLPSTCDFPPCYLDDHAAEIRLVRAEIKRVCKECGAEEMTTWAGPEFFCAKCRSRFRN